MPRNSRASTASGTADGHGGRARASALRVARLGRVVVGSTVAMVMILSSTAAGASSQSVPDVSGTSPAGVRLQHGTVEVDGGRLHFVRAGSGSPLVLLHGWPETWVHWSRVMPALAETHTVIAFDLPGLGDSTIPADGFDKATTARRIRQAVHRLGFRQVALMGHDVGSMVAFAYARDFPTEVTRLSVIESPLPGFGLEDLFGISFHFRFNMAPAPIPERILDNDDVETYLGMLYSSARHPDAIAQQTYFRAYGDPRVRTAGYDYYRALPADAADNQANAARRLPMPVLAMGAQFAFGPLIAASFRQVADDVREVIAPDSGHWVAEENPAFLIGCSELFFNPPTGSPVPPELVNCRA